MFGGKGAGLGQGPPVQYQGQSRSVSGKGHDFHPGNLLGHHAHDMANLKTPPSWNSKWKKQRIHGGIMHKTWFLGVQPHNCQSNDKDRQQYFSLEGWHEYWEEK